MQWQWAEPVTVPENLFRFVGGHPLVATRLARAGLTDLGAAQAFLDPAAYSPGSPFDLPDLAVAVERLQRAIRAGERILIWGDFDVDGQTATALLFTALLRLGANVRYHVPLRDGEGHGMQVQKLRQWLAGWLSGSTGLILTCDTGITSHEAVRVAQSAGVDVIVTDHHLLGETLPPALAVVNPMRLPPGARLREMPGVGVAYQLISGLSIGRHCDDLLDLVALGIVADVAELRNETRYLLQRGLAALRLSERRGMRALLESAGINQLELDESDLGFSIAPRLNAQGRLGNAAESVELLTTEDPSRAAELANQMEGMNARRKLESRLVEASAQSLLDRDPSLLEYAAIVLSHPDWGGGVVGIVASRLADAYHKPVVLLCEKDGIAYGSARSVPGCNITDALRACRDKLGKFGGHVMAAGLSLRSENIFEFRRMLSRTVREMMPGEAEEPRLELDGELRLDEISLDLALDFRRLAPFGNGNPPPALASRDLRLVRKKKLGRNRNHLELLVEDKTGARGRVLWWNAIDDLIPPRRFDLAYTLRISRFQAQPEVVLELRDLQPLEDGPVTLTAATPAYEIEDYRSRLESAAGLADVLGQYPDAIVWREADPDVAGCNRTELKPAEVLIVWTTPPGPEEWQTALDAVSPGRIIIFGRSPAPQAVESFLQRLGGLIKYVINAKAGRTTLGALAAATAERSDAVRYGLKWFQASGQLGIDWLPRGNLLILQTAGEADKTGQVALENLLKDVLEETVAYRNNWTV